MVLWIVAISRAHLMQAWSFGISGWSDNACMLEMSGNGPLADLHSVLVDMAKWWARTIPRVGRRVRLRRVDEFKEGIRTGIVDSVRLGIAGGQFVDSL